MSDLVERAESSANPDGSSPPRTDPAASSSAGAVGASAAVHNLVLTLDDVVLPYKMPVFQALRAQTTKQRNSQPATSMGERVWEKVHTIHYRRIKPSDQAALEAATATTASFRDTATIEPYLAGVALLKPLLSPVMPCELQQVPTFGLLITLVCFSGFLRARKTAAPRRRPATETQRNIMLHIFKKNRRIGSTTFSCCSASSTALTATGLASSRCGQ